MIRWKKNDGLTLVELMVSITIGSLIMLAASTVLLLGLRINHQTTEAVTQQYTARTFLALMEDMASEGIIDSVVDPLRNGSWVAKNSKTNKIYLSYSAEEKVIYTGDCTGETAEGTQILQNIVASYVSIKDNVLTISLEDFENTYTSSVYCRMLNEDSPIDTFGPEDIGTAGTSARRFLNFLLSQQNIYGGIIDHVKEPKYITDEKGQLELDKTGATKCKCEAFKFFSEWYVGKKNYEGFTQAGWNSDTPWCACFVSWGLVQSGMEGGPDGRWYANVDNFMQYFEDMQAKENEQDETNKKTYWRNAAEKPNVGDLIFFNMIDSNKANPSHMGAVFAVEEAGENKWDIYTIEGNSADKVAVRKYSSDDPDIIGYGVLQWSED